LYDDVARRRLVTVSAVRELFVAVTAYAEAYGSYISNVPPSPDGISFARANDLMAALWTGLRATLAVVLVGCFWIISAWPHGPTAVILAGVATARLATMGHAVPLALAATMIFALATVPAFVIVDVLLPLASGFPMFALIVSPMLFGCAFLMSKPNPKTMLIGFMSALLFASVGQFQNRMVYDAVGLLNTSIAVLFATGVSLVLWAVIAPETAEAARRRFLRVARQAVGRLTRSPDPIGFAEFETRIAEAFDHLQSHLRADQPGDIADLAAGIRLVGVGRLLLSQRETNDSAPAAAVDVASAHDSYVTDLLDYKYVEFLAQSDREVLRDAA